MRVLFATSECAPLCKTGGLADVAQALPAALIARGADVRILLPGYREVLAQIEHVRRAVRLPQVGHFPSADLLEASSAAHPHLLVLECPPLYERDGGLYTDAHGADWLDNALRFGFFSHTAALLSGPSSPYAWRPDVLHCNDWQCGLAPAYQFWRRSPRTPCLMTIHNLAYQGVFPRATLEMLGLPAESFDINGVEYYGGVGFLKAGLYYAHRITTVSPTYAREIQSEPLGFGLHGLLAGRSRVLEGVLNGIDTALWDPANDAALAERYDARALARKRENTRSLRRRFGLREQASLPLLGMVSRLVEQKGVDLVAAIAQQLALLPAQLLVLGTGDAALERELSSIARGNPSMIAVEIGFDEGLSHLVEAGADIFLMPSRFEPCGLNQMYSQRYGTPPVVRRTGGLADTVVDANEATLADDTATGFVFDAPSAVELLSTIERAIGYWRQPTLWRRIQRNAMRRDFSWGPSAQRYLELYRDLAPAA